MLAVVKNPRSDLFFRYASRVSSSGRFGTSCTPSADPTAATTSEGLTSDASPTKQTAPSVASLSAVAARNAVWVLPTPPAPVSVTIRWSLR
ncbi:MAG: hypothetical protein WB810_03540, partial [Candidatus Cybelea sp.]